MKYKILVFSHAMELGGAERSLIGLLDSLDPERVDIDLFLLRHEGELMDMIPPYVHLLPHVPAYTVLARPMKDTLKEGHVLLTNARLMGKLAAKWYARVHGHQESMVGIEYSHKFTCPLMPRIQPDMEYDLAISFLTPHYFVAHKVQAKKRIAWIHTDYSAVQVNVASETKMWAAYDHIAAISPAVTESFLRVFPSMQDRLVLIENILPARLILRQVHDHIIEMRGHCIKLLSIGRFCPPKNFENIPEICAKLCGMGFHVMWYLIGFGGDEEQIRSKILEMKMEQHVIVLGKKNNPYPYIAACDLYVQPSRYEGKAVTVREAQLLGKPVVITRYATSASQLEDGVDGVIVPMDNQGCAEGIANLLRDPEKMAALSATCKAKDYSNCGEVEKLYQIMER